MKIKYLVVIIGLFLAAWQFRKQNNKISVADYHGGLNYSVIVEGQAKLALDKIWNDELEWIDVPDESYSTKDQKVKQKKKLVAAIGEEEIDLEKLLKKRKKRLKNKMMKVALDLYQDMAQYPLENVPLKEGSDPLVVAFASTPKFSSGISSTESENNGGGGGYSHAPEGQVEMTLGNLQLKGWKDKEHYIIAEDEVTLYLEVYDKGQKISAASVEADIYNAQKELVTKVSYQNVGDNTYAAIFNLGSGLTENAAGKYYVAVKAEIGEEGVVAKKGSGSTNKMAHLFDTFSYQFRKAKFRNRITDELTSDKNLLFKARFNVYEEGQYIIQGTLYDKDNKLVALSEKPLELSVGTHWVPLEFYGYLFHDQKLNGPYYLKNIALNFVKKNLASVNHELNQPNYKTQEYQWEQFNSVPYNNSVMQYKVNQIQDYLSE